MTEWSKYITNPSVNLILGFRGQGKTALAYYLTELAGEEYGLWKTVFGVPRNVGNLLPEEYMIVNSPEELPQESVVIVDEISLHAYARRSGSKANELWDKITANSRKNKQIIFYITHHSRKVDINLVTDIDNLIYKKPSSLQILLDRPAVRKFAKKAYNYLRDKDKSYSYLFSFIQDSEVGIINPLPKFWTEELSDVNSVVLTELQKENVANTTDNDLITEWANSDPDGLDAIMEKLK